MTQSLPKRLGILDVVLVLLLSTSMVLGLWGIDQSQATTMSGDQAIAMGVAVDDATEQPATAQTGEADGESKQTQAQLLLLALVFAVAVVLWVRRGEGEPDDEADDPDFTKVSADE